MGMESLINKKKGVALLWTLIICLVLLIVSGTMVGYIVKDSRASVRIEDSVQAYAAAKSGMDWGAWYVDNNVGPVPITKNNLVLNTNPNVNVSVSITRTGAFPNEITTVESLGEVNGVQRQLHYTISPSTPRTDFSSGPIGGSFMMEFDFWTSSSLTPFEFGVKNSSSVPVLYMRVDSASGCAYLESRVTTPVTTSGCLDIGSDTNKSNVFHFKGTIKYVKNISATLEIAQRDPVTMVLAPLPAITNDSIPLFMQDFGQITSFYSSPPYTPVTGSMIGDGSYWLINNQTGPNYIDNVIIYS
jgi:uncharacterized protein (UPF0333 family)